MPEKFSGEKEFMYIIFKNERMDQSPERINLFAGMDVFKLQFVRRHILRIMNGISVV